MTNRDPVLLAFPRSFSAKQVYLPLSACVTLRISRLPSSQMNTLRRKQNQIFTHTENRKQISAAEVFVIPVWMMKVFRITARSLMDMCCF